MGLVHSRGTNESIPHPCFLRMLAMLTNYRCLLLPPSEDDLEVQPFFIYFIYFYSFGFALQEIPTPLRGTAKSMPFFHCQKWNVRTILRGESNFFSGVANQCHLASPSFVLMLWEIQVSFFPGLQKPGRSSKLKGVFVPTWQQCLLPWISKSSAGVWQDSLSHQMEE